MADKLLSRDIEQHFYYPWDIPWIVKRAVDTIDPVAYVVMETEIWPNILYEMKKKGIPTFLVNGRFSDKSFEKRKGKADFWRDVLSLFTLIMVREQEDCNKLALLDVPEDKVFLTGDCKVDALINRVNKIQLDPLRKTIGINGGPLIVAGSTHIGEDEIVLEAFGKVRKIHENARLIHVPRHPERSESVREMAAEWGQTVLFSELDENTTEEWDILVIDKIGYLLDLYGISDAAFVGGSLVPKGGQNLMEPAIWGVPVTHGPHMEDFREASAKLGSMEIARTVSNAHDLAEKWLEDVTSARKEQVKLKSSTFFEEHKGASRKSWELIRQHIKK
jgi:3-deoxy-D-manno-octulosonic-acid transferase